MCVWKDIFKRLADCSEIQVPFTPDLPFSLFFSRRISHRLLMYLPSRTSDPKYQTTYVPHSIAAAYARTYTGVVTVHDATIPRAFFTSSSCGLPSFAALIALSIVLLG